ncbi:MAG: MotA/TolQ/ExbB proton channel family protein [Planctomycetes bacterium]|nr:MotA/TolQ/ExbB proton channel family protein [Planctomycetota bacterium]
MRPSPPLGGRETGEGHGHGQHYGQALAGPVASGVGRDGAEEVLAACRRSSRVLSFIGNMSCTLGLLGTVVGVAMALEDIALRNPKGLLVALAVALYTTSLRQGFPEDRRGPGEEHALGTGRRRRTALPRSPGARGLLWPGRGKEPRRGGRGDLRLRGEIARPVPSLHLRQVACARGETPREVGR